MLQSLILFSLSQAKDSNPHKRSPVSLGWKLRVRLDGQVAVSWQMKPLKAFKSSLWRAIYPRGGKIKAVARQLKRTLLAISERALSALLAVNAHVSQSCYTQLERNARARLSLWH